MASGPLGLFVVLMVPLVRNDDSDIQMSAIRSLARKKHLRDLAVHFGGCQQDFNGEFDPGSGRTLAACLTHASRAVRLLREYTSGERVSNT